MDPPRSWVSRRRCRQTCNGVTSAYAMDNLNELFEQAAVESKNPPERPDNLTLLKLYSLYKQATEGDVHGNLPDVNDFVGRAKWEAWSALKGTPVEQARQDYIDLVQSLK